MVIEKILLEGNLLYLRPLEMGDEEDITLNVNDPEVVRWTLLIPYPYPDDGAIEFIHMAEKNLLERTSYIFGIILRETNRLVGVISLDRVNWAHRYAHIGYWLGQSHWNRGIMTEAVKLISDFGFNQLGLFRIDAVIFEENTRSGAVLEKCGFKKEGIERSKYHKDGKRINGTLMSLLPEDLI